MLLCVTAGLCGASLSTMSITNIWTIYFSLTCRCQSWLQRQWEGPDDVSWHAGCILCPTSQEREEQGNKERAVYSGELKCFSSDLKSRGYSNYWYITRERRKRTKFYKIFCALKSCIRKTAYIHNTQNTCPDMYPARTLDNLLIDLFFCLFVFSGHVIVHHGWQNHHVRPGGYYSCMVNFSAMKIECIHANK